MVARRSSGVPVDSFCSCSGDTNCASGRWDDHGGVDQHGLGRRLKRLEDLPGGELQRGQRPQPGFNQRVFCNELRLQLLPNPLLDAEAADSIDVAGTRTERQPVQDVENLFVLGELLIEPAGGGSGQGSGGNHQCGNTQGETKRLIAPPR